MAGEHRSVAAQSTAHAQGLADNLNKQGFEIERRAADHWVLRKKRRRGDLVVTILIRQPSMIPPPPREAQAWAPPAG